MNLKTWLSGQRTIVEKALRRFLPTDSSLLSRAMRYSVMAGGKRLRPVLVIEASTLCGGNAQAVMPAACALEFIHTYSLIHDDLPAMDNDDLRRGMPTSHKKFGEATAILAGDALLTGAFGLMTECGRNPRVIEAVRLLAAAAGNTGMVGGQMEDTVESGRWRNKNRKTAQRYLRCIHEKKTGALITASLLVGATLAGAGKRQAERLERYGKNIGLAFQITDDILDVTGDKKLLGKKGSDRDNDKLTYPALYGLDESARMAPRAIDEAKEALSLFGGKAAMLAALADYIT